MTDNNLGQAGGSGDGARNRWVDDAQAALDRTVEAIKVAWDSTRESRMSALDSAKQAAEDLAKVVDQGVTAARDHWSGNEDLTETKNQGVPLTPAE